VGLFYNRTADFIEVIIKDGTGAKIEKIKARINDKRACRELLKRLRDKYGFEPLANFDDSWVKT